MADLRIPLHDLDTLGRDFVFALDASWLKRVFDGTGVEGDASAGNGEVAVHAQRNGQEILVHGQARARLIAECGRCLKGLPVDVSAEIGALYAPAEAGTHKSAHEEVDPDEIDPEGPDLEQYTGDELFLDDLVRDHLLLELPLAPKCDKGWSCPNLDIPDHMRSADGVHSSEGFGEHGVDPRLAPLMKLAKKGESDKE
jgi:uncharacterized protein